MNFYDYYQQDSSLENPALLAARCLIELKFKVLPCEGKLPVSKIRSVNKLRLKPIHENNIEFYFTGSENLAILTGENLEVIDIDCKYDLTGKLYKQFATAIRYTLPDVWDKLVVQRSSSGGYHLFYRCPQIGGNATLARRDANGPEKEKGERIKTLIETRGEGGYIMISPTPGYEFIQGDPTAIETITPDERAELFAIARSFNQLLTLDLPGISKVKQTDENSPWNRFNAKHDWTFIRDELVRAGWETLREDDDRIFILRPGAMSKTSGAIWKETNVLFLFTTSTEFPERHPISPFDVVRYLKYDGDVLKAAKGLAEQGYGDFKKDEGEFYTTTDNGEIKHSLRAIITWMNDIGIRKYHINDKDFEIVHVVDNKVSIVDTSYLKKLFTDYVHKTCPKEIDEYFLKKIVNIFSKESIVNLLDRLDENFLQSTVDTAWLFYQNAACQITSNKIIFYEYETLPGYIWAKSIIERKIVFSESECAAKKFIGYISNAKSQPFESAIGYMLHAFKDAANPKAIILYDEYFDESKEEREPEGGTGKGIFIKMLSKFRTTTIIDGKDFNNQKNFAFQQVGPETEIVAFEDVKRNFDFESLFSKLSDDWTIEKKHLGAFTIPFERSAKVIITSNYMLRGSSKSHMRRRFELEVSAYFNSKKTIIQEFGHRFFSDWVEKEWNAFDNYFIECLQSYLKDGLIQQFNDNIDRVRLLSETNRDFVFWIEKQKLPKVIPKEELMTKFVDQFPDYRPGTKRGISQSLFTRWLLKWCELTKTKVDARNDYNGKMCYRFPDAGESSDGGSTTGPELTDELPF